MMKVKILVAALIMAGMAPAQADGQGAWVKVDASGNAVGQAIVCTSDVCGDRSSPYAKATLGAGEQYVLQTKADPVTNNVAGIGNNNPGVQVKVDLPTNTWTVASTQIIESPAHPNTNERVKVVTQTTQTFNPFTQPTPKVETVTNIERKVATNFDDPEFDWNIWWQNWVLEWDFFGGWYSLLFDKETR
jgi:hypothetical protein